jgi:hypothetical protein
MTSYGFMIDFSESELRMLRSALAHYLSMCGNEIRKGGTVPFLAHEITIEHLSPRLSKEIDAISRKRSVPEDFVPATTRPYDELSRQDLPDTRNLEKSAGVGRAGFIHIEDSDMTILQVALLHYRGVCQQKIANGAPVPFIGLMTEINQLLSKLDDHIAALFERDHLPDVIVHGAAPPKHPDRKTKR